MYVAAAAASRSICDQSWASTASRGATHEPPTQATLPSESLVIQGNAVSTAKVGGLIRSEKFDAFVSKLASESYANPLSQDVTAMEKERLENFFGAKGAIRNFACGTGICAGTITLGKDPSVYKKFSDDFLANGLANASLLDYQVQLDNGEFEQRLVMSVDPNLKGVAIPTHP